MKKHTDKNKKKTIPLRFGSGKIAAARLGIPDDVVKWCRQNGCSAFEDSNRVRTLLLLAFIGERLNRAIKLGAFTKPESVWLDPAQEAAKLNAAKRREIEDAEKIRRGEMHVLADVENLVWQNCLAPLRAEIVHLSRACASQCNPLDPVLAKKVLDDFISRMLEKIRAAAPEEMPADAARIANSDTPKPDRSQGQAE